LENILDQFYTNDDVVDNCISTIEFDDYDIIIEPSAGDGAFYNKITGEKIGIDLDPKVDGLIEQDYLKFDRFIFTDKKILVIGNPPFGKNSSLAVKFFKHSALFANTIAFILPRTFRKASVINRLNENFNLVLDKILPPKSFHLSEGTIYDVPCVWQIWKKGNIRLKIEIETTHPDFVFLKNKDGADFVFQRVGGKAGWTHKNLNKAFPSHYWIKGDDRVYQKMQSINWDYEDSPKFDTAGNPSISKNDLIKEYKKLDI
jgi:hypothetical protein